MATNVVFETDDIRSLTEKLGVDIDAELLGLALTHRSYAYEHGGIPHNERLEFLGDSILGQAVTVMLYTTLPDVDEGALAKRRASVVSTVALAEVARTIGLGAYLKLGRGEENTGGRDKDSLLADATEAIIGAAYLSAGAEATTAFVLRLVEPLLADPDRYGAAMDPKTSLQELASRMGAEPPEYVISSSGPDHQRRFTATVTVADASGQGEGTSKKNAEMAAALTLWQRLSEGGAVSRSKK
ncbi:ribonuclease III [Microbacterium sp. JB110]|uniref:ribonuclease III n=1 Tax=Microbacterium sp. JB110 TaxID=2024477 RepID=UPI00097E81D4|nr:ribonuclease III [Microbacterium sp. JB110]SJM53919.1 Ribonuclease III [Frigoribacterium sp. JB110]